MRSGILGHCPAIRAYDARKVREVFPHADLATVRSSKTVTIFNIAGNHHRLITAIHYNTGSIFILETLAKLADAYESAIECSSWMCHVPISSAIWGCDRTILPKRMSPALKCRLELVTCRRYARLLLIDDLGKGRMTPAVSAELFALIDHMYCHALPTIWTANSTPEQIASNLSEDMAGPFAGRLNDSSRILRFK